MEAPRLRVVLPASQMLTVTGGRLESHGDRGGLLESHGCLSAELGHCLQVALGRWPEAKNEK